MPCSFYRKQIDVCYACGRLGHRADVCPTPGDTIWGGCGVASPDEQHVCTPKCKLCGGQHLTASKDCARRFKIPYIVRRRRSQRAKMAGAASPSPQRHPDTADEFEASSSTADVQRRGRPRSRGRSGGRSGFRGRGASKGMFQLPLQVDGTGPFAGRLRFSASLQLQAAQRLVGADQVPLPHAQHLLEARSRHSPGPTRPEEDVSLQEATTRLAVLPKRRSATSCDELTSS
ncbi:hypothetical protein MTO96_050048 [Rhipicephalus appendiculatus]